MFSNCNTGANGRLYTVFGHVPNFKGKTIEVAVTVKTFTNTVEEKYDKPLRKIERFGETHIIDIQSYFYKLSNDVRNIVQNSRST